MPTATPARSYTRWEDAYGLMVASTMLGVGAHLLHLAAIATGGTVGLSLMLSQMSGLSYGLWSIALNLPLFLFGWRMMGTGFILKSLVVTLVTAVIVGRIPHWLIASGIEPAFAALAGGTLVGMGALAAARHGAAAGGTLVVVLWLQRRTGLNAGLAQLAVDCVVVLLAFAILGWKGALWSALGIVAADAMIMTWHRPTRDAVDDAVAGTP